MSDTNGVMVPPPKREEIEQLLLAETTAGYVPSRPIGLLCNDSGPDFFQLWFDLEEMLLHPRVGAALMYYKGGIANAKFTVKASSPEVGEFALKELESFWKQRDIVQRSYDYGRVGCEVIYKIDDGKLVFDRLGYFQPTNVVVLTRNHEYMGIRVRNVEKKGTVDLWGPKRGPAKAFWHAHNTKYSRWYGLTQCYGAWRPWRRLAGRNGAEEVTDHGVYRYAFSGPVIYCPFEDVRKPKIRGGTSGGMTSSDNTESAPQRLREYAEKAKAGAYIVLPSSNYPADQGGGPRYRLEWPKHVLDVEPLGLYSDRLEDQISLGIGVFPELMEASASGGSGYAGRAIPLEGYYVHQQQNAEALVRSWKEQIGDPEVKWNFGAGEWFEIEVESLLESRIAPTTGNDPGKTGQPPLPGQPPHPQLGQQPPPDDSGMQFGLSDGQRPSVGKGELKPPAHGHVRLWRGVKQQHYQHEFTEPLAPHEQKTWDHIMAIGSGQVEGELTDQHKAFVKANQHRATAGRNRFYGDNLQVAKQYAGSGGKVLFVDVPHHHLKGFRRSQQIIGGTAQASIEIPHDYHRQKAVEFRHEDTIHFGLDDIEPPKGWGHIVTTDAAHLRIIGETQSGKTTIARAIAATVTGKLAIIDPVWRPGAWGGLPAATVSRDGDYEPIREAIQGILGEMRRRTTELQDGKEDFERLTVVFDEVPDTVAELPNDAGFMIRRLGQRGRHVNIHLVGIGQSMRVGAWGIEGYGDAIENFATIYLGKKAVEVVPSLAGVHRPAVLEWRGKMVPLDMAGISERAEAKIPKSRAFKFGKEETDGKVEFAFQEDDHPRDEHGQWIAKEKEFAKSLGYEVQMLNKAPKKWLGKHFGDKKTIEIYAKGRTTEQIRDTLHHEIGHLVDYKRRGIVPDPFGDSVVGYDGKLRPAMDSDIYFRDSRKDEAERIRQELPRKDSGGGTQKEIYADAYKLFRKNPSKLKEIAPRIYKELSDHLGTDVEFAHAPAGGVTIGGTFFKGGEFIPGEVLEKATAEEKEALGDKPHGKGPGKTDTGDSGLSGSEGDRSKRSGTASGDSTSHGDTPRHWRGAEEFPEHYRAVIDAHIRQMPRGVQEYIKNTKPHFQYLSNEELDKSPGFIKGAMSQASALCLNHGRIIFTENKLPADKHVLQHELVHNSWHRIPKKAIEKIVEESVADGEKLHILAMRRKLTEENKWDSQRVKRMILSARKAGDKQFSLELDLMVPDSALVSLAEEDNLPIKDPQYLTIALHAYMAKKGGYTLPDAYAQEEVVAYKAGQDDKVAEEVLQYHYPTPKDPRGYHPVLDRRGEKWVIRTVGNASLPSSEVLPHTEWDHEDWKTAVAAADKANATVSAKGFKVEFATIADAPPVDWEVEEIIHRATDAAQVLGEKVRQAIIEAVEKFDPNERIIAIRAVLDAHRPELERLIGQSRLASILSGMQAVAERLPTDMFPTMPVTSPFFPPVPPLPGVVPVPPITAPAFPPIVPPVVTVAAAVPEEPIFPVIRRAAENLAARRVLTRDEFDVLDSQAKREAFTYAGQQSETVIEKVRDVLAQTVEKGGDTKDFIKTVDEVVGKNTFVSKARAENIFRTNAMEAYSDGQEHLLRHPIVSLIFPYAAYYCIHDDRLRATHLALESMGIQGTNIYRRDDQVWKKFRPPWDYQDRCGWSPISIEEAARRGIEEAKRYLADGVWPVQKAHVEMPPFESSFVRRGEPGMEFAFREDQHPRDDYGKFTEKVGGIPASEGRHVGGYFVRNMGGRFQLQTDKDEIQGPAEHVGKYIHEQHESRKHLKPMIDAALERGKKTEDADEYGRASTERTQADKVYGEVVKKYRAKEIGDDEYLAARKSYNEAVAKFDAAFEKDSKRNKKKSGDFFGGSTEHEAAAFERIPVGEPVVSLAENTHGRLGKIVDRDGKKAVKLDGTPGYASNDVEPLDKKWSWRARQLGEYTEKPKEPKATQATFFATKEDGQWITIGAKKGPDGKKHGGSPVFVSKGRITKGHPRLTGRKIDALQEEAEPTSHRKELNQSKGYGRAVWAKKARNEGINPAYLHQLAAETLAHDKEYKADFTQILKDARQSLSAKSGHVKVLQTSDKIEDAAQVPGLDEVAEDLAKRHPSYFPEAEHASDILFSMLREGNPETMAEDDAYEQAFEHLMGEKQRSSEVPFSLERPQEAVIKAYL